MRRHRNKKRELPSTPNSKAALINDWLENATPHSAEVFKSHNLKDSRERHADAVITDAAATVVKSKCIRKKLLPELRSANKSAVSQRLGISRKSFYHRSQKNKNPRIKHDVVNKVLDFYNREDITTTYPNKTRSGKILKVLKFTCKQTYNKFVAEYGIKISQSTFNKLKPRDIKLMRSAKFLQCLCDICDNVGMLRKAINSSLSRHGITSFALESDLAIAKAAVCSISNLSCLDRQCKVCSPATKLRPLLSEWLEDGATEVISYVKWCRVTEVVKGKEVVKMKKVTRSGKRWELFNELCSQLENYPLHLYNGISQLKAYKLCKESLRKDEAVVVCDFAENYVVRQYAEAQNAYYSRNSITIHPMVMIFNKNYEVSRDSVIVISDDLKHDHCAVKVFIQTLANHIAKVHPSVNHLIIWSDGAGSQYKSRNPMYNICNNFFSGIRITWNFYGSRHGKGEADGESAVVKNALDRKVKAQQLTLHSAYDCYESLKASSLAAPASNTMRHFYFIDSPLINCERDASSPKVPIPQVRKLHQVKGLGNMTLAYRRQSCYCQVECNHANNDWETFKYPGIAISH